MLSAAAAGWRWLPDLKVPPQQGPQEQLTAEMRLSVVVLRGSHLFHVEADGRDTVGGTAAKVERKLVTRNGGTLVYDGRQLQPESTLAECGVGGDRPIYFVRAVAEEGEAAPAGSWILLENVASRNFTDDHQRIIRKKTRSVGLEVLGSINSKNIAGSLALRDRLYWYMAGSAIHPSLHWHSATALRTSDLSCLPQHQHTTKQERPRR